MDFNELMDIVVMCEIDKYMIEIKWSMLAWQKEKKNEMCM